MKLKKKHRPMKFQEWVESAGGQTFAYQALDGNDEGIDKMANLPEPSEEWKEAQRIGVEAMERYHEYLCLHISFLLEKKR